MLECMLCGAAQIKQASRQAGVSTASMGKFDERLPGEKAGERVTSSKRQKYDPVSGKAGTELKKVGYSLDFSRNST
jgi:regulator of ribosome biosynthesis